MAGLELKTVYDAAKDMGLLASLKDKLTGSPNNAHAKLADVLAQVSGYSSLNSELGSYLCLDFEGTPEATVRRVLDGMSSGEIELRLETARFHCKTILPIYETHLRPWFQRVVPTHDRALFEMFFYRLADADSWVIQDLKAVAEWLAKHATHTRSLYDAGKRNEAAEALRQAELDLRPIRRNIVDALRSMIQIQAEFVQVAGV